MLVCGDDSDVETATCARVRLLKCCGACLCIHEWEWYQSEQKERENSASLEVHVCECICMICAFLVWIVECGCADVFCSPFVKN